MTPDAPDTRPVPDECGTVLSLDWTICPRPSGHAGEHGWPTPPGSVMLRDGKIDWRESYFVLADIANAETARLRDEMAEALPSVEEMAAALEPDPTQWDVRDEWYTTPRDLAQHILAAIREARSAHTAAKEVD